MRLHVVSLPHTQVTKAYSTCAYTEKVRKFAVMMRALGHEVFVYAGEDGDAIECITKAEQAKFGFNGPQDYLGIDFNAVEPWKTFNERVVYEISTRIKPHDLICLITGDPAKPVADAFPGHISVEFGVGYKGIVLNHAVFESRAWQNFCYGRYDMDGRYFDAVIPNYFEVEDFPLNEVKSNYYLFIGRLNANKGLPIAQEVCEKLGKRLIVAGPGQLTGYGEPVGVVAPHERAALMGAATATFVPTQYIPPFEGVHIESMLCGTPVITTDFGVFAETVTPEVGARCGTFQEFCDATEYVKTLNPRFIRDYAATRFSTGAVAAQYEAYFAKLLTLYHNGWYTTGGN